MDSGIQNSLYFFCRQMGSGDTVKMPKKIIFTHYYIEKLVFHVALWLNVKEIDLISFCGDK